jgi:hypothetical protein
MKNEYRIEGDTVRIFVESKKHGHKEILVDMDGFFKINEGIKGTIGVYYHPGLRDFYARYWDGNKTQKLHRFLLDFPDGFMIDHINHNTLDNRYCNLRLADNRFNQWNQKRETSSKYPGVSWYKRDQKWRAYIRIDGRLHNLGLFESEEEAYEAYVEAYEIWMVA